ncbi:transcriptional regulator GcvA [Ruegeria atlantica]|uniref:transcriptional regulator GcvA n=1 Tax=Ruegeria atlantica TaxID=81569 RepID=UPI00148012C1|nr:transcriptional regulator GcvA [Ruegeria atlantica]
MAKIPSLKSIQAFEAACRHLSFKDAADELCVTPTAISHQIKSLEDQLGVPLFHRLTRALKLTEDGANYAPHIIEAFKNIEAASLALEEDDLAGTLTISTTGSFAANWLSPRLRGFYEKYPEISVRVLSSDQLVDFKSSDVDVAIRYGFGDYPDSNVAWVLNDWVAPVCSVEKAKSLGSPEDLLKSRLIEYQWSGFSDADPSWERWMDAAGLQTGDVEPYVTYSEEHICLLTASDGHGVALVSLLAAARFLERNMLVAPFDAALKNKSYFLVCPETYANRARVRVFREWLLDQADEFRDSVVGQRFFEE